MRPSLGGGGGSGGNISGGGDAAHRSHGWLARLVAELESMPAQVSDGLRDRFLADASLAGSHEVAGVPSAAAALRWAIRKHGECLSMRQRLHECLEEVSDAPTEEEVRESGECGRCRMDWGKTGAVCAHCKREARYDAYFYTLFSHRRQRKVELLQGGASRDDAGAAAGNVGEAFLEDAPLVRLLNSVIGWLCAHGASIGASSSARAHVWAELAADAARERDTVRLLKREIRACRALWAAHFDLLSQLDEVGQCVRMMELVQTPDELERLAPLEAERHLYVGVWEYDERASQYESALTLARDDLREFKGKYSFLRKQAAIADARDARGGGAACEGEGGGGEGEGGGGSEAAEKEICPVCHDEIGRERTVPRCAHSLCTPCAEQITRRHSGKFVCPLCREGSAPEQASDLRLTDGSAAGTAVKGSWGTKVTAVVEQVLALPAGDKCLIFSQWDDLLLLVSTALRENGVAHARLHGKQTLDAELSKFRHGADVVALLLPLKSGANGINLVEAQHVFLVEPLIEAAVEAQAVGRVHRMSQTRATTVHRFVVQQTIEENILGLRTSSQPGEGGGGGGGGGGGSDGGGGSRSEANRASHTGRAREAHSTSPGSPRAAHSAGSPNKRARKSCEESKVLSWETVHALFSGE